MLYDHARESGADAREGHEVLSVEQIGPRETRLEVRTDEGRSYGIQARYLVDASGRDAFLSAKKKLRRKNTTPERRHLPFPRRSYAREMLATSHLPLDHGWMWIDRRPAA